MAVILNLIQGMSRGGAARAMMALAKYTTAQAGHRHQVAWLSDCDPQAVELARNYGMEVLQAQSREQLLGFLANADLVHVHWWNNPEMGEFFRSELPATRLLAWFHIAGDQAPQVITPELIDYVDFALGCSPHTVLCPSIAQLSPELRSRKVGMAYGAADFGRMVDIDPVAHSGFNIGYIGTVHYLKMHPHFVRMSAAARIPDKRFIVCGEGDVPRCIEDAKSLGASQCFDFRGYVEDIPAVIRTLDVYGYPLCEDTYAAAEVNLQEVMFAGLPVVVFPHGGIRHLVINDFTGLVVHSELEYTQALEFLYHNPAERKRLGENAKNYAKQIFGSENAARKVNKIYQRMLAQPKRKRVWGKSVETPLLEQEVTAMDVLPEFKISGAEHFINSLGDAAWEEIFKVSLESSSLDELFAAESRIENCSPLMRSVGIQQYRKYYPADANLHLWLGLALAGAGEHEQAAVEFAESIKVGNTHFRLSWYLARSAAQAARFKGIAAELLNSVILAAPDFQPAYELLAELQSQSLQSSA